MTGRSDLSGTKNDNFHVYDASIQMTGLKCDATNNNIICYLWLVVRRATNFYNIHNNQTNWIKLIKRSERN